MKTIGLTGGIAMGKSTVAGILTNMGFAVIDADRVARDVVAPGSPVLTQIAERFGNDVISPDGTLDRARLGQKAFGDPALLSALNQMTHPAILAQIQKELLVLERLETQLAFLEVPLLYETGMDRLCQGVIVVTSHPDMQLDRLKRRSGLSDAECKARIKSQWPEEKKTALAQFHIDNSGHVLQTEAAVREVLKFLLSSGKS